MAISALNVAVRAGTETTAGLLGTDLILVTAKAKELISAANANQLTSPVLQPETVAYQARVVAAGSAIDAHTLGRLDQFITRGKSTGWFSLLLDFAPMVGSNLTAALVKLVYPAGGQSALSNNGVLASEYTPAKGVVMLTNTTSRYLGTGFVCSANGLSTSNLCFGTLITDSTYYADSGNVYANNSPAGDTAIFLNNNAFGLATGYHQVPFGPKLLLANYDPTDWQVLLNGSTVRDNNGTVNTFTIDGEMTLFKSTRYGTPYYANAGIGSSVIASGMAKAQAFDLHLALLEFYRNVGRIPIFGGDIIFYGDSITSGQGGTDATATSKYYPNIVARRAGLNQVNIGSPSSQWVQNTANAQGGYIRLQEVVNLPGKEVVIYYGTNDQTADAGASGTAATIADYSTKMQTGIQALKDAGKKVTSLGQGYLSGPSVAKYTAWIAGEALAAKNAQVPFVDLRFAADDAGLSNTTGSTDGTHPTDVLHAVIAEYVMYGRAGYAVRKPTLTYPSIAAGGQANLTVTVMNAVVGMEVVLTPPILEAGLLASAFVTANDTVTVRLSNLGTTAIVPAAAKYVVRVTFGY